MVIVIVSDSVVWLRCNLDGAKVAIALRILR